MTDEDEERRTASPQEAAATSDRTDAAAAGPVDVQAYIGRQLRAVYDDIAKQPIPERFLHLMQALESKGGKP